MDRIRELMKNLANLTAEELTELRGLIVSTFKEIDGEEVTPETVAQLNELADAGDAVMTEASARETAQAEAVAAAEAARARIAAMEGEPADEEGKEEGAEGEGAEGTEGSVEEGVGSPTPAPVAASGAGSVGRMAARAPAPKASPEAGTAPPSRAVLTATGAMRGDFRGRPIEDRYELATAMADTLGRMSRQGAATGDVIVASAKWDYPEERQLNDDPTQNAKKMDAITHPSALVATGGICTPVNVDYAVPTWATADRPLRDALPAFQADRGGIRFVQPPDIGGLASATGIWTSAVDAAPGAATKPVLQIACGTEVQVLVDAISTRLGFGNMQSRFAPEQVAANTDLAMAAAARIAENNILTKIAASCTAGVTSAILLGATRDLLVTIDEVTAAYRWFHRLPRTTTFTAIFPDWLKEIFRADLAREIGHQQSTEWNVLMISDAQIEAMLQAHNVRPIWHIDGQPAQGSGTTYPLQGFATQAANGAVNAFPAKAVWYFFPEGTFQFLDGGRLDLGVVRDATLDATNDYETFVETFEAIAFRGFSGGAYQMVSSLCANGGTAGTISTAGSCA